MATAPLFPAFPPMPVFTVSIATSLEQRTHTRWGRLPSGSEGKADAVLLQRRATWWRHGLKALRTPDTIRAEAPIARDQAARGTCITVHSTSPLPFLAPGPAPWGRREHPVVPAPSRLLTQAPTKHLGVESPPPPPASSLPTTAGAATTSYTAFWKAQEGPSDNQCIRNRSHPVICAGLVERGGFQAVACWC